MSEANITDREVLDRLGSFVVIKDYASLLFDNDERKAVEWLMAPNSIFFNCSPFQIAMGGKVDAVIAKMKEWLGFVQ